MDKEAGLLQPLGSQSGTPQKQLSVHAVDSLINVGTRQLFKN